MTTKTSSLRTWLGKAKGAPAKWMDAIGEMVAGKAGPVLTGQLKGEALNAAVTASRVVAAASTLGALTGAAVAPKEKRMEGAFRGAIAGLTGAAAGMGVGKHILPAVGGAILGGAAGGASLRKESSMKEGFKFAGVTLDYYDDHGETLKQKFPTPDELPGIIKTASIPEREKVPNEAFALIMVDQGYVFRKYACADPGTTAMSVIYFMEHGDKLPEDAQKLAASNLVRACVAHGIMPPATMTKVADLPPGGLADDKSGYDKGQIAMGEKVEMEHTDRPALAKEIAEDHLQEIPDYYTRLAKLEEAAPERKKEAQVIDITGRRPNKIVKQAAPVSDEDYAVVMPDGRRLYPIHNWDMVKRAEAYFHENRIRMQPNVRRQYAVKLARKSFIIGYPLNPSISELGALGYNNNGHIKASMEMRKVALDPDSGGREFLDDLFEKHASIHPEVFAEVIRRFDVETGLDKGWDQAFLDPWASTFGVKTAEVVWEEGADRVTDENLQNLALNHKKKLLAHYGDEFVMEFVKDPAGIFNSLPEPEKKFVARLADDISHEGGSETNVVG